jgi:hypothetical protein
MKKLFLSILILLTLAFPVGATDWYASSSSANMSAITWNSTASTGCTTGGSGPLTWANRTAGDVFYANSCTAIAVDADPGANGKVTLRTAAGAGTAGGGFTYALAANLGTLNIDVTSAATVCLTISGNANDITIVGNIVAGTGATGHGVNTSHTVKTLTVTGTVTGGTSGTVAYGIYNSSTGLVVVTGNVTGVTSAGILNNSTGTITVTGEITAGTTGPGLNCAGNGNCTVTCTTPGAITGGSASYGMRSEGTGTTTLNSCNLIAGTYIAYIGKTPTWNHRSPNTDYIKMGTEYFYIDVPAVANVRTNDTVAGVTGEYTAGSGGAWGY